MSYPGLARIENMITIQRSPADECLVGRVVLIDHRSAVLAAIADLGGCERLQPVL